MSTLALFLKATTDTARKIGTSTVVRTGTNRDQPNNKPRRSNGTLVLPFRIHTRPLDLPTILRIDLEIDHADLCQFLQGVSIRRLP